MEGADYHNDYPLKKNNRKYLQKILSELKNKADQCDRYLDLLSREREPLRNFDGPINSNGSAHSAKPIHSLYHEVAELKTVQLKTLRLLEEHLGHVAEASLKTGPQNTGHSEKDSLLRKYDEMKKKLLLANLRALEAQHKDK